LFDKRIEDREEYKQTHGHLKVKTHEDNSLYQFCKDIRHSLKKAERDDTRKLTEEHNEGLDDLGFEW
jgi:hypothetical protein